MSILHLALGIELALATSLSLTWLAISARRLTSLHWRKTHIQAPSYTDQTTQLVGILQQIQIRLVDHATLSDVQQLIAGLQQNHGEHTELETTIQQLVGQQLRQQVQLRKLQKVLVAA